MILHDSNAEAAETVGESLRRGIQDGPLVRSGASGPLSVRVSLGVAAYPENAFVPADLVSAADRALYHAKRTGKNRVARAGS